MTNRDEISSTERLLELIRGRDGGSVKGSETVSQPSRAGKPKRLPTRAWASRSAVTVGIEFGYEDLKLVKIRRSSGKEWELIEHRVFAYDPEVPKDSPEFSRFLRESLTEFCGQSGKCELWCLLSSAQVELRHIRIPKVPKNQVANAVYWTFKKEVPFDEEESVLDFEVLGLVVEEGIEKMAVMAYCAGLGEINKQVTLFSDIGFPLAGLSIVSFAIRNLLRTGRMNQVEGAVGSLYISDDWSRVDIFSSENLILARGIKSGMNSLVEGIMQGMGEMEEEGPLEADERKDGVRPEAPGRKMSADLLKARRILFSFSPDSKPLRKGEVGFGIKAEDIYRMIEPPLDRLVRQIERTLEHFAMILGDDEVAEIYMFGAVYAHRRLDEYVGKELGIQCRILDPFAMGLPPSSDLPSSVSLIQRASYAGALGVALSSNENTPNLLFTHKDKEKLASQTRIRRAITAGFVLLAALCLGLFFWQERISEEKASRAMALRRSLEQYRPLLSQDLVSQMAREVAQNRQVLKANTRRYKAVAVIGELSRLTPSHIRLINVAANLRPAPKDKDKDKDKEKAAARPHLVLEGIILGDPQKLEGSLATYLLRLEGCPLFGQPAVEKSNLEQLEGKQVLRFMVRLALV